MNGCKKNKRTAQKSAVLQFMGCVILFTGLLSSMLEIKAASGSYGFTVALFIIGAALLFAGAATNRGGQ